MKRIATIAPILLLALLAGCGNTAKLTEDEAKAAALERAGITDARFYEVDQDLDDGTYEFEFVADGIEYDIEVNMNDGSIVKYETDRDDVRGTDKPAHPPSDTSVPDTAARDTDTAPDIKPTPETTLPPDTAPPTQPASGTTSRGIITEDEAKAAALKRAGLTDAVFTERDQDFDDGKYEFEFKANGFEYEVEVNAYDGSIIEFESDRDDRD